MRKEVDPLVSVSVCGHASDTFIGGDNLVAATIQSPKNVRLRLRRSMLPFLEYSDAEAERYFRGPSTMVRGELRSDGEQYNRLLI